MKKNIFFDGPDGPDGPPDPGPDPDSTPQSI